MFKSSTMGKAVPIPDQAVAKVHLLLPPLLLFYFDLNRYILTIKKNRKQYFCVYSDVI